MDTNAFTPASDSDVLRSIKGASHDWKSSRSKRERAAAVYLDGAATDWEIQARARREAGR